MVFMRRGQYITEMMAANCATVAIFPNGAAFSFSGCCVAYLAPVLSNGSCMISRVAMRRGTSSGGWLIRHIAVSAERTKILSQKGSSQGPDLWLLAGQRRAAHPSRTSVSAASAVMVSAAFRRGPTFKRSAASGRRASVKRFARPKIRPVVAGGCLFTTEFLARSGP